LNRRTVSKIALALLLLCAFTLFFEVRLQVVFAQLTGSIIINDGDTYTASSDVTLTLQAQGAFLVEFARYSNDVLWRNDNEGWEDFAKTKSWTLSSGDGGKRVYYQFADYFGEISDVYSDTIVLDTVLPTGSIVINGGEAFATSTSVSLELTGVDLTSGVDQVRLSNTGSWSSDTAGWESYSSPKSWTLSSGDGFKNVYCQFKDGAGSVSVLYTDSIGLDTSVPAGSIVINDGGAFTASTSVTLSLTANDPTSGVYRVRYSNDGVWDAEPWEDFSPTKAWALLSGDGDKTVYYQIGDRAGLSSAYSDTIGLDTVSPTGSIVVNDGDAFTTSVSVSLMLTAADSMSGVFRVRYSNDGVWDTEDWEDFSSAKSWTLSSGNGEKTVYYQVRDNAGLNSSTFSDTITLSTLAPTGSIVINDDADSTTSGSVTLTLTYTDPFLPVSQVRYSNDGVWDSEEWESPSETKEWILSSGNGTKTVYYQIRNSLGSVSDTFIDTIILDTSVPIITPTPGPSASPSASPSDSPTPSPEPTRNNSGVIPPEAFYATAAIGIASIAAIVFLALKKPKSSQDADNFATA